MIPRPGARDEASTQRTRCDSHWLRCHGQRVPGEAAGPVSTQMISAEYMTRRLLKSRAFKDRRALAPFVMSFSIMDASERSQLSRGIVSLSTYDPVYLPVPSFASFLSKHVICPSDNDQRQRVS